MSLHYINHLFSQPNPTPKTHTIPGRIAIKGVQMHTEMWSQSSISTLQELRYKGETLKRILPPLCIANDTNSKSHPH